MNKQEFVELVQSTGEYKTKAEAEKAIKAFTEAVTTALAKKEDVALVGFGSWSSVLQAARSGKVPGTDKTYTTEEKYIPKFKSGATLKDRVAAGK